MNDKTAFYLSLTIILIFLFSSIEKITIEFIKSSNESEPALKHESAPQMPMFMFPMPENSKSNPPNSQEFTL